MTAALQVSTLSRECRAWLRPTVGAPAAARRLVRELAFGLPDRAIDNAALVAGELVRNSVFQSRSTVEFTLCVEDGLLVVRVCDRQTISPDGHEFAFGRSHAVLSAAAETWGFEPLPRGRALWANVRIDAQARR